MGGGSASSVTLKSPVMTDDRLRCDTLRVNAGNLTIKLKWALNESHAGFTRNHVTPPCVGRSLTMNLAPVNHTASHSFTLNYVTPSEWATDSADSMNLAHD